MLQALTSALQNEAKLAGHERPLFIGIDQENGLVTRISPPIATQVPGPMALGATHDPKYAYEAGKITGETLSFFGINMNYAPVCDINSEPLNPVIGVRSPGDDPEFVGQFASAAARGLREKNIIPSVKHFPGHGDTAVDSHYGLPVINKTRDQLERCELIPFRRAVAEGIETVMTAHISLPSIDEKLPATLSPTALGILRKDMGYDGVIITDCLEMEGIKSTIGSEKGAVLTIKAGSDSVMMCHTFDVHVASIKLVTEAAESGEIEKSRFDEACRRVAQLKDKFLNWDIALRVNDLNDLSEINKKSLVICQEAYENSVTVVRDEPGIIPLSSDSNVVFLFPGDNIPVGGAVDGEGMGRQGAYESATYFKLLQKHNQAITEIRYKEDGLKNEEWEVVEAADVVIFTSLNARESPYQESLGNELPRRTRALIAIAACSPYDFIEARDMTTYITTYEPTMEAFSVAADIIFGKKVPRGALPIGTKPSQRSHISVGLYNPTEDLEDMVSIWNAALPSYALPADSLRALISSSNQQHFVARVESRVVGFCLAYLNAFGPPTPVHIAAVAVLPEHQGRGIGSALLTEARSHFRSHFSTNSLKLGSNFPRFWPGIPRELSAKVQDFFVHRGFRLNPLSARSTDLYQDIRNFVSPEKYINRARERGFRFAPLRPQDYAECLIGQKKNFSYNAVCKQKRYPHYQH